jgi:hypothetical protein
MIGAESTAGMMPIFRLCDGFALAVVDPGDAVVQEVKSMARMMPKSKRLTSLNWAVRLVRGKCILLLLVIRYTGHFTVLAVERQQSDEPSDNSQMNRLTASVALVTAVKPA